MRSLLATLLLLLPACAPQLGSPCRALMTSMDDPQPCAGQTVTFSGQLCPPGKAANLFIRPAGDDAAPRTYLGTAISNDRATYSLTFKVPPAAGPAGFVLEVEADGMRMGRNFQLREGCEIPSGGG